MSITENAKKFLLGLAGACGSIAGIVALLTNVFEWDVSKVTAVVSIVVAVIFSVGYAVDKAINKVNRNLDKRLDCIKEEIARNEEAAKARSHAHDLSLSRLELSDLIKNDSKNTVAIRKKARHYFCELDGNDWMGERYAAWAKEYDNGDLSILSCENEK